MHCYPLYLQEAVVSMYPQAPDGSLVRSQPVWLGGVVEGLDMSMTFQRVARPVTGGPCPVWLAGAQEHRVEMRRLWVQRLSDAAEAKPRRGRHVLVISWHSVAAGIWRWRRYRDCYFESGRWSSNGRIESAFSQVFTAGRMDEDSIGDPLGVGADTFPPPPGNALPSYVSDHPGTLTMGMAVCLIAGKLRRATNFAPYNTPIGLVFEGTLLQGVSGRVQTDLNLTMTTLAWDAATGMVGGLAPGQTYFLSSTGAITPFAPSTGYIVPVGLALSSTTFRIGFNSLVEL